MELLDLNNPVILGLAISGSVLLVVAYYFWSLQRQNSQDLQNLTEANSDLATNLALARQAQEQIQKLNEELKVNLSDEQFGNREINDKLHAAEKMIQVLKIEQQKDSEFNEQRLQQFEESKKQLKIEFENLANEILKNTQKQFNQESRDGLELFLKPFRQQVNDFKSKVEEVHSKDLTQRAELKTELKHLHELNKQMTEEANQLSTALKGQKKTQGNWGELILENVLDRSGLQVDRDYHREVSFNTEDGRRRPDVIVHLPDGKNLVIDAKVSLNAYTRFVNAEDEIQREQAIKEHVQAFNQRMNDLSGKNYFDLPGIKSPEMVFMFVPIESAFVEAIRADEQLFQVAIEKKILITTPTTLLTSLNIVRQLWRFEDQNKHTAKIASNASKIYNQLRLFLESMDVLGYQLDKAQGAYKNAKERLVSGRGNLVKQVAEFEQLGVAVKKEMPKAFVEQASLEMSTAEANPEE